MLVGPRGDFAWMCFPRWHDDAVFSSLLGGRSTYSVRPAGRSVWGGYYEPGSLVWRSRWVTEDGIVECREALAVPADEDEAVLLRRAIAVSGPARLRVLLRPGAEFDRHGMARLRRGDDGCWKARMGGSELRWSGAAEAEVVEERGQPKALAMGFDLEPGESRDFVLSLGQGGLDETGEPPERLWKATSEWWRERDPGFEGMAGSRDARHAYTVMTGLTSGGGGMVAAATASLPERADRGRNYDYRYVWMRDQCYAGQAAARAGGGALLGGALGFVAERLRADGPDTCPAYTVTGVRVPEERRVGLPGYPGGGDTVGNQVHGQFQLDVFGEALLLFAAAGEHDRLDADHWRAAEVAAEAIAAKRGEAEAGIWELEPRRWTHSQLICAAGLRALAGQAPRGETRARWLSLADDLAAEASRWGLHSSGRWQRAADDPSLDASLLLGAIRGAVPADDPRSLATLAAVEAELTQDGYCYRFQPDGLPLGDAEGAFLLCGFWMALAHAQQGDREKAVAWFERNRAACGPPGLLSEEFDVRQRQLRGNLPQAFVHALLLETAAVLGD